MRTRLLPGVALVVCLVALGAGRARAAFPAGDSTQDLPFGGVARQYLMHVPPGYDGSTAVPLVVDIHGWTSNAIQQRGLSGMRAVSDANGFLVVYPDGLNNAWNANLCCDNKNIDDVGFIRAVAAAVQAQANVDPRRIYVTGLSNGGAMSQRLACDAADLFAASAPMAFPLAYLPATGCQPSRSIPVLTVMGLTDMLVRYDGPFGSALGTFDYWRDVDGCGTGAPEVRDEKGKSYCEYHTSCANGVQVGLCSVTARAFPGAAFDGHVLYLNEDYDLAGVAWSFLSQFSLPDDAAPAEEGALAGPDKLKMGSGVPRTTRPEPLSWSVRLGQGTWSATDSGGVAIGGSWRRAKGGKRTGTAALTTASLEQLAVLVESRIAQRTGTTGLKVGLESAGPIRVAFNRAGEPTSLRGTWRILRAGEPGASIGRYSVRLRRAR
jgi:polyhydroxybutyrate depolymerase